MFVTLVVFAFTLFTGCCEELHVAVRLLLPTPPEEGTQTCQLLRSRSPNVWDKGGFLRCIARQPITTVEGKVIVPYSITVNSSNLDNFPEAAKYADKVAFINQMLNSEVDSCLTVTGSNWCKPLNKYDSSFSLEVHTKGNVNGSKTLECDDFGDRTPQISFACESLASQGDEDDRRFKLDYSDDLNSQLMDPLDNIEAQLFIHWYLNEQLMGCHVIQYNLTKHHFSKVSREGYFTAVISGPIPETFCQEIREEAHYAAHSCAARGNIGNKSAQIENAIYYLRPQEPFYQFDLPWYLNKYNELINQMNEHKQKCEFNGFIKLYQGDEVGKR